MFYCLCKLISVCISSLLQSSGLQRSSLHLLFNALVINKLTYALPAYADQLTAGDKDRINAMSRKAMRRGLTLTAFDIDAQTLLLTSQIANSFIRPLSQVTVCTIFTLLKPPPTVLISFGRGNIHTCLFSTCIRS